MTTMNSIRLYYINNILICSDYLFQLVNKENVRGVISLNEDYELKYAPTAEVSLYMQGQPTQMGRRRRN